MSPTENSWMLRPLNKASLGYCVPDRCVLILDHSSMELAPSAATAASVGLRHLMDQWGVWPASPTPLTRFIGLAPLRRMHTRPTNRTPPLRSAKARGSWKSGFASLNQIKGMGWFGQGQNSQGTLCPRDATSKNIGRGHIGRGWTNIAPFTLGRGGRGRGGQREARGTTVHKRGRKYQHD